MVLAALDGSLRPSEALAMRDESWCISDIVLWEIAHLARAGRTTRDVGDPLLSRALKSMTVWSIDERVAQALRQLDFRSDPADELIAATSLVHNIPLLTRDMRILASKVVPLALV